MHLKPAEYVIQLFGGVNRTARAIGRDPSSVSKWRKSAESRGCDGNVPRGVRHKILSVATDLGLDITSKDLDFGRDLPEADGNEAG